MASIGDEIILLGGLYMGIFGELLLIRHSRRLKVKL
jgi:hypothetical protein